MYIDSSNDLGTHVEIGRQQGVQKPGFQSRHFIIVVTLDRKAGRMGREEQARYVVPPGILDAMPQPRS